MASMIPLGNLNKLILITTQDCLCYLSCSDRILLVLILPQTQNCRKSPLLFAHATRPKNNSTITLPLGITQTKRKGLLRCHTRRNTVVDSLFVRGFPEGEQGWYQCLSSSSEALEDVPEIPDEFQAEPRYEHSRTNDNTKKSLLFVSRISLGSRLEEILNIYKLFQVLSHKLQE